MIFSPVANSMHHSICVILLFQTSMEEKTIVVIGSKGCGKSTLCNIISGRLHDEDSVFVPNSYSSENPNETVIAKEKWNGDGFDLSIIDTPGFSSSTEDNTNNIYEMSKELVNFEGIHLFLIVLDIDSSDAEFGSSVNPITTRGADYAHHITVSPPGFENPAASLSVDQIFYFVIINLTLMNLKFK